MNRSIVGTSVLASIMALALALPAAPSRAQGASWDQDRVTELANELADVTVELQAAFRREDGSKARFQRRARHRFGDALRVARTETRALASSLESGAGRDETWPIVRRLGVTVRDLQEDGRRMAWREPTVSHARRAQELLTQLAPFYAGEEAEDQEEAKSVGAEGGAQGN
jgi:hypothetical protein